MWCDPVLVERLWKQLSSGVCLVCCNDMGFIVRVLFSPFLATNGSSAESASKAPPGYGNHPKSTWEILTRTERASTDGPRGVEPRELREPFMVGKQFPRRTVDLLEPRNFSEPCEESYRASVPIKAPPPPPGDELSGSCWIRFGAIGMGELVNCPWGTIFDSSSYFFRWCRCDEIRCLLDLH